MGHLVARLFYLEDDPSWMWLCIGLVLGLAVDYSVADLIFAGHAIERRILII
jgi:hypothetical protein